MSRNSSRAEGSTPKDEVMSRNLSRAEIQTPKGEVSSRNRIRGESPTSKGEILSRKGSRREGTAPKVGFAPQNLDREEGPPPETVRIHDNPKCEQEGCELTRDDILYQNIEKPKDSKPNPNAKLQHFPKFSKYHPLIPRRYVQEWKTDMKNRKQLITHAVESYIYPGPHDESLFLQRRERLNHGEARCCVERKIEPPDRFYLLHPLFYHHLSRYQSGLMYRHETKIVKCSCQKE